MDFTLTEKEKSVKRDAYEIAKEHFAEDAFTHYGDIPDENVEVLAEHGYLGMTLPEEYGGQDATFVEAMMAMEGIGLVCPETARMIRETNFGHVQIISEFGAEHIKERFLPPTTRGETWIGTAMSEPKSGSSTTDLDTSAESDGDEYVVNGHKIWVSSPDEAETFNTFVRLDDGNVGTMLIDADSEGLSVQNRVTHLGRGQQGELIFDDVRVPKDNELLVGSEAFKKSMYYYNLNRVLNEAHSWVVAKWLFEDALEYAQERETWGTPISEYQGVSHRLVNMAITLETARLLIYRALSEGDLPGRALSCMTKVYCSEKLWEVADRALQIKGARGYLQDSPEGYSFNKLRASQIAGGTTNIHRNNVAKALYKEGYPDIEF